MTSREISAVLFYNTLNMSSKEILKLGFTALTYIFVFRCILNRLIYNLVSFPSFRRRGGPGSSFVRAGIGSRAGVVEENLMVIISRLKRTK